MKKIISFIGLLILSVAMSFSVYANSIKTSDIKVDNDLLYLYNNNVYKNDTFKFNITLNDSWTKPTYEQAHVFAFNTEKPQINFICNDGFNPNNNTILAVSIEKLTREASTLQLDNLAEMLKSETPKVIPNTSNYSNTNSSTISAIPFRYFTFDLQTNNKAVKSYMYFGVKDNNVYIFYILNVNNANKTIISKALKSIVIQ